MNSLAVPAPQVEQVEPEINVAVTNVEITAHRPRATVIGLVEAKDEAMLTSPLETEVLAVLAEEGDAVAKNAPLIKLDVRETNYQLEAQLANIDDINAQLGSLQRDVVTERRRLREIRKLQELAEEEYERNNTLLERGIVAQAAVDNSEANLSARELEVLSQHQKIDALLTSRLRLEASERATLAQVGQLRLILERARIQAPFDGIVKVMNPSSGTRVARGSELVQLYDPNSLRLRAAIPNEYSNAGASIEAEVPTATGTQIIPLVNIAPEAKPGRGNVDALFSLPAGNWLLGSAIEFDLLLPLQPNLVAVPFDSLYSGSRVYIVDGDSRAQAIECTSAGQTYKNGQTLALLRCPELKSGDKIVINRIPNLLAGTKLNVPSG